MAIAALPPPPTRAPFTEGSRVRLRTLHRDDVIALFASLVAAISLVWVVYVSLTIEPGSPGFVIWSYLAFLAIYYVSVRRLHGRKLAADRLATVVITTLTVAMLVPLLLIIGDVVGQGWSVIAPHFFFGNVEECGSLSAASCGGVGHAILGSLEQVGIAMVIAVPLAIACAVFLNEIGGKLRRPVRIFVDAMSGIPSIVAGLFIFSIWNLALGHTPSGFGAAMALSILMLPTVTRTTEEVLRLVPGGLREGSLALGASEWRTVRQVVLPTALSGIITAVLLGVARVVGETAPLLVTAGQSASTNANPFGGNQEALSTFVYQYVRGFNPGTGAYIRGWGGGLVLVGLVLFLFTLTRVLGARGSVDAKQRRAQKRELRRIRGASAAA